MKVKTGLLIEAVLISAALVYVWCFSQPATVAALDRVIMTTYWSLVDAAHAVRALVLYVCNSRVVVGTVTATEMILNYLYKNGEYVGEGLWYSISRVTKNREAWQPNTLFKIKSEDLSNSFVFGPCQKLMFVATWRKITSSRSVGHLIDIIVDRFLEDFYCFYYVYVMQWVGYWIVRWIYKRLYAAYAFIQTWRGYPPALVVENPAKRNFFFVVWRLYALVTNWVVQVSLHVLYWSYHVVYHLHIVENFDLAVELATNPGTYAMWLAMVREHKDSDCLAMLFPGMPMSEK